MDVEGAEPRNRPLEAESSEGGRDSIEPPAVEFRTPEQPEDIREAGSPKVDEELEWAQFIRNELIKKHGTKAVGWQPLTNGREDPAKAVSFAPAVVPVSSGELPTTPSGSELQIPKRKAEKERKIHRQPLKPTGSAGNEPRKSEREADERHKYSPIVQQKLPEPAHADGYMPHMPEPVPAHVHVEANVQPDAAPEAVVAAMPHFVEHAPVAAVASEPLMPAIIESAIPPAQAPQPEHPNTAAPAAAKGRHSGSRSARKPASVRKRVPVKRTRTAIGTRQKAISKKKAKRNPQAAPRRSAVRRRSVRIGAKPAARKKRAR